jgi:hypothetical protein
MWDGECIKEEAKSFASAENILNAAKLANKLLVFAAGIIALYGSKSLWAIYHVGRFLFDYCVNKFFKMNG